MTRAHYYSSTTRIFKDGMQYIQNPLTKVVAYYAARKLGANPEKALDTAEVSASLLGGLIYNTNTATFQAIEAQSMDRNARKAVAAELGILPEELKYSDYLHSNNVIVKKELADAKHLNRTRYLTDALLYVPAILYAASAISPKYKQIYEAGRFNRTKPTGNNETLGSMLTGAFNFWDVGIYGAKAAYWMYETYAIPKSAHYEIVKVGETIEATGKKFTPNDLIAVVNRSREDRGLTQIQEKDERNKLWEILDHLADKMNNDKEFGVPELVYLVGLNKINIFELDEQGNEIHDPQTGERIICQKNIDKTIQEIDKVANKGLVQMAKEKQQANAEAARKGFVSPVDTQLGGSIDKVRFREPTEFEKQKADWIYEKTSSIKDTVQSIFGGAPRQTTDYVSSRDPLTPSGIS